MRSPSDDEDFFRRAVADVSPLRASRRAVSATPRRPPVAAQRNRDEQDALAESLAGPLSLDDALETGEELVYLRDGLPRQVLRKLRRAHWVIEANLDLHGMNRGEAALGVAEFMRRCRLRGARCVRIVHGKGLGSRNREPVLKGLVRKWLMMREEVLAFCQAPATHGGSGAVLVLLKASR
jgi:DNA-nicking Smr family endonuclease